MNTLRLYEGVNLAADINEDDLGFQLTTKLQ